MPNQHKDELQDRIARLEQKVEELEHRIEQRQHVAPPVQGKERQKPDQPRRKRWQAEAERLQPGEQWLNRIGIGLLLVGVAFLFKYSIDQGWLIPPVRSAIGLGIGLVLFVSGLQMRKEAAPMKQILLGGGIATFYITGFATFQLYSFLSGVVIWPFMIVVTLLALSLSLQQDEAVLSVVGTVGALGTPFMLYTGGGSVVMLMGYTVLVLAGSSAVYLAKGWTAQLWSIMIGGLLVMCVGMFNTTFDNEAATWGERWALQAGTIFWATMSWWLSTGRAVLKVSSPSRWPNPGDKKIDKDRPYKASSSVHLQVFLVPLLVLGLMIGIWDLSMEGAGVVAIAMAVMGGLLYLPLTNMKLPGLASTHIFMALVMLTVGFVLLLEGNVLFTILAAEAVALRFIAWQTDDEKVDISSHLLFAVVVLWLINMLWYSGGIGLFDFETITQLAFLAAGGILIPRWLKKSDIQLVYRLVCHILFLYWLYVTISGQANGQAWVTVAWCAYAVGLLVLGFIQYGHKIRLAGMSTIFLVVGKLVFFDLSQLQAIWRILLFIGFGALFLLMGYYWQSKLESGEPPAGDSNN